MAKLESGHGADLNARAMREQAGRVAGYDPPEPRGKGGTSGGAQNWWPLPAVVGEGLSCDVEMTDRGLRARDVVCDGDELRVATT